MKSCLLLLCFLVSISIYAQPPVDDYIPIHSTGLTSSLEDLYFLDPYVKNVRLLGMGESTHGTHEFFTMRSKVFRLLVERYGYTTFFLEADYATCLDIDHYIKSGLGSAKEAVSKIALWPWETWEMVELVEWMRSFNLKNPKRKLSFIGCDMQKYQATLAKMDSILLAASPAYPIEPYDAKRSGRMELEKVLKHRSEVLTNVDFNPEDRFIYETLLRHLGQIIYDKYAENYFSYRDISMAENIVYHLERNPSSKGFYWAHNLHVFNIYKPHKNKKKAYVRAGGMLRNKLGDSYFIIGQEFDYGSFNAYQIIDRSLDSKDKSNFEFKEITIEESTPCSFGHYYRNSPDSILFI